MCGVVGIQHTGAQSIEISAGEFLQNLALSYLFQCLQLKCGVELLVCMCVPKLQGEKAVSQQW